MKTLTATWITPCEWRDNDFEGSWWFSKLEVYHDRSCYFRILGLEVSIAL